MSDAAIIVEKEISIVEIDSHDAVVVERDVVHVVSVGIQGPPGPAGTPGNGVQVIGEVPSGAVNGSNATFITAFDFIPETVVVIVNGLRQKLLEDFNTSGADTILLNISPTAGDNILVDYMRA